ncbi:MAG: carboxymuconolactone decarboxylase family protein [Pseudomonadota bacterium]
MDRIALAEAKYRELFGEQSGTFETTDPEFMAILRRLIFGEVFHVGELDDTMRELVTLTVLTVNQTLPQLGAHVGAALNIGIAPVTIRETVYQCAPFIGFPKTLNAIGAMNEVFRARGIALPLPGQSQTTEADRFERGLALQTPIYGDEIRQGMKDLPEGLRDALPDFLTAHCFGDFYTRSGLTLAQRELLVLCLLAALGGADAQMGAHARGSMKAGNDKASLIAALVHGFPYMGFPRAINAIRSVKDADSVSS